METNDAQTIETGVPPRKKRRWWVYLLIGVGCLALLAGTALVVLVSYYKSLIRNYTTTQPVALAPVAATPADFEGLKQKWGQFYQNVVSGKPTAPFKLTEEDLNALVANIPQIKDRVRLNIEDGKIRADFSVPLDQTKKAELKGRYLNGVAWLKFELEEDGFPALYVISVKANGKEPPGWFEAKVKKKNLLDDAERNPHLIDFVNRIDEVGITNKQVVITPVNRPWTELE